MTFRQLKEYIGKKMRMQHIYQPVNSAQGECLNDEEWCSLRELLYDTNKGGKLTLEELKKEK